MGYLLVVLGIIGLFISGFMFGDIGIAGGIGSLTAIFSGIGINTLNGKINKLSTQFRNDNMN